MKRSSISLAARLNFLFRRQTRVPPWPYTDASLSAFHLPGYVHSEVLIGIGHSPGIACHGVRRLTTKFPRTGK